MEVILTDTHLKEDNLETNKSIYKQTLEFCKNNGIKRIFHLGDILDSRKAQTLVILKEGFLDILDMCQEYGITLLAIPGNHCKTDYKSENSFLDPFCHHPNFVLLRNYYSFVEGDCKYHFLPFFANEQYLLYLRVGQKEIDTTKKNILFTHVGITGATMNSGIKVEGINTSEFKNYQKVIVGHYHDSQFFSEKICYIGSALQHNYGENEKKGLWVLEGLKLTLVKLKFPEYYNIEVNVDTLTQDKVDDIIKEKQETQDNIRITLTGSKEKVKAFNKKSLLLAGLSVETKIDITERETINERVEPLTPLTLTSSFKNFCIEKKIDVEVGMKYLEKTLN